MTRGSSSENGSGSETLTSNDHILVGRMEFLERKTFCYDNTHMYNVHNNTYVYVYVRAHTWPFFRLDELAFLHLFTLTNWAAHIGKMYKMIDNNINNMYMC